MEIDFNTKHWDNGACPKVDCRKNSCKCGLEKVFLSSALGDDSKDSPIAPKNGAYCNAIVVYEANNHVYIYSKEGIPTLVETGGGDVEDIIEQLEDQLAQEILDRQAADNALQGEIDDLKNSPDVVDIVATYAALQAYDTSHLGDNDIVRVLADETHDGDSTYYRWDKQTETWTYIGGISVIASTVFYADKLETGDTRHIYKDEGLTEEVTVQDLLDASEKGQVILRKVLGTPPSLLRYVDMHLLYVSYAYNWAAYGFLFSSGGLDILSYTGGALSSSTYHYSEFIAQRQLTAGANITIDANNEISATDTTYSAFVGTDGVDPGTAGLVPAPATTDADKFLKSDGTWDTVSAGPTVVQTTGTSTTDVMSQNATTSMVYANPASLEQIRIGKNASASGSVSVAIGYGASAGQTSSVAIGRNATTTRAGEMNIGTGFYNNGYNNTKYRVLGGVHDAVDGHDATTLNQLDGRVKQNAGAPTTSTVGTVGQLLEDTTNGKLYQCTAIDTTDPNNPSYTWTEVGAGGGGPTVVQTTGTSTTDVMSQNATTSMVFDDPTTQSNIKIGSQASLLTPNGSVAIGERSTCKGNSIAIGSQASAGTTGTIAIGPQATLNSTYCMAIGNGANGGNRNGGTAIGYSASVGNLHPGSVALGANAICTRAGEVYIGSSNTDYGYNSTNYRVLGGVHDPVNAHDAATKGYVDGLNVQPILESAFNDAGDPVSITLAQYQQIETACLNFRPLFYNESDIGLAHCVHIYEYECTQNAGINLYLPPRMGGYFEVAYNDGAPYAVFNIE